MALSVQEILDLDIPDPTISFLPSRAAPLRSDMDFRDGSPRSGKAWSFQNGIFSEFGDGQVPTYKGGVLLNQAQVTNHVEHSSDIGAWGVSGASIDGITRNKFIEYPDTSSHIDPRVVKNTGSNNEEVIVDAGAFTADDESYMAIFETANPEGGVSERVRFRAQELNNYTSEGQIEVDVHQDDSNEAEITATHGDSFRDNSAFVYKITDHGPNGGAVWKISFALDGTQDDTTGRRIRFNPDIDNNSNGVILHHAQCDTMSPNGTSTVHQPIVTTGSSATRNESTYQFNDVSSDWPKGGELTIVTEFEMLGHNVRNGFNNSTMNLFRPDTSAKIIIKNAGYNQYVVRVRENGSTVEQSSGNLSGYERSKLAVSFTENEVTISLNGDTPDSSTANGIMLNTPTKVFLGSLLESGVIYSLKVLPEALTADALQTLTS